MKLTPNQQQLFTIKGIIGDLPPAQAEAVRELTGHIKAMIKSAGEPMGTLALARVALELQIDLETTQPHSKR